jgi:hypothetical protein
VGGVKVEGVRAPGGEIRARAKELAFDLGELERARQNRATKSLWWSPLT